MSKKSLIVLSVCLLLGAGIAVGVWASCCPAAPICNGTAEKIVSEDCDYQFTVDLNSDCMEGTIVELHIKAGDAGWVAYMMQLAGVQDQCAQYFVELYGLDPELRYDYYFTAKGYCTGQDPSDPVHYALYPLCE